MDCTFHHVYVENCGVLITAILEKLGAAFPGIFTPVPLVYFCLRVNSHVRWRSCPVCKFGILRKASYFTQLNSKGLLDIIVKSVYP